MVRRVCGGVLSMDQIVSRKKGQFFESSLSSVVKLKSSSSRTGDTATTVSNMTPRTSRIGFALLLIKVMLLSDSSSDIGRYMLGVMATRLTACQSGVQVGSAVVVHTSP